MTPCTYLPYGGTHTGHQPLMSPNHRAVRYGLPRLLTHVRSLRADTFRSAAPASSGVHTLTVTTPSAPADRG